MSINRTAQTSSVLAPGAGESVGAVGVAITFKTVGAQSGGAILSARVRRPAPFFRAAATLAQGYH